MISRGLRPSWGRLRCVILLASVFGTTADAFPQVVRERASVELVSLSLTALDEEGRDVVDLEASDLVLRVDGNVIKIESLVNARSGTLGGREQGSPTASQDRAQSNALAHRSRPTYTAFLIDEADTTTFDRRDVLDQLLDFVDARRGDWQWLMVARFDGANTQALCSWTADPAMAAAALREIRKHPNVQRFASLGGRGGVPLLWVERYRERFRRALLEMIVSFPEGKGERQLVVGTGGLALLRPEDTAEALYGGASRTTEPNLRSREKGDPRGVNDRSQLAEQERDAFQLWARATQSGKDSLTTADLVAKANERDVKLVPIASEAFDRGTNPGVETKNPSRARPGDGALSPRMGLVSAMQTTARETGGEAILTPRKASGILTDMGARPRYLITFKDPARDHRTHEIALRSSRPGVRLNYRRSYRVPTDDERTLDRVESQLLRAEGDLPAFPVQLRLEAVEKNGHPLTRVHIRYVPPPETIASPARELSVLAVGADSQGVRTEPIRWKGRAQPLEGDRSEYGTSFDLGVPAGSFRWSFAITDDALGVSSFLLVDP